MLLYCSIAPLLLIWALLLWLRTSSHILRLPCQIIAEFKVKRVDTMLNNLTPIATFEAMDEIMCKSECIFHNKCKSLVITNEETCLLFHKSHEDIRDNAKIVNEPGYTYYSTLFNESQIGPNCKSINPCGNGKNCFDICECPGYRCIDIDHCISNPCKYGGNCSSIATGYKCNCIDGFSGKQCESPNLQWIPSCELASHVTNIGSKTNAALCYYECTAQRFQMAYYDLQFLHCYCKLGIDYVQKSMQSYQCTHLPNRNLVWEENCAYIDAQIIQEAVSKWHCYYLCKPSYKSATWDRNQRVCNCGSPGAKEAAHNSQFIAGW